MTSAHPLVSVIVPTYNHGSFIGKAVQSALQQTYDHLEVIVIDNYSNDNTSEVLARINDPRVKVFKLRKNKNQGAIAASRNYGVKQSSGEVLAFLDADDSWLPQKLAVQLPHLRDNVACVSADFIPTGDVKYCIKLFSFITGEEYRDFSYADLVLHNPLVTSSIILKRERFEKVGGFDESREFFAIEDWELWLRMASELPARHLRQPLIYYRVTVNKDRDPRDICANSLIVLKKHCDLGLLTSKQMRPATAHRYLALGKACLDVNSYCGLKYYSHSLLFAGTGSARIRAAAGLLLFCVPPSVRNRLLEHYYDRCGEGRHRGM
jgi:glycosyltransferase involved in cell wall biosynthesis